MPDGTVERWYSKEPTTRVDPWVQSLNRYVIYNEDAFCSLSYRCIADPLTAAIDDPNRITDAARTGFAVTKTGSTYVHPTDLLPLITTREVAGSHHRANSEVQFGFD